MPEGPIQPDLRCYHHPERTATSQCDRCGDYLCAECMKELAEQYLCPTCYRELMPARFVDDPRVEQAGTSLMTFAAVSFVFNLLAGALVSSCSIDIFGVILFFLSPTVTKGNLRGIKWSFALLAIRLALAIVILIVILSQLLTGGTPIEIDPNVSVIWTFGEIALAVWCLYITILLYRVLRDANPVRRVLKREDVSAEDG